MVSVLMASYCSIHFSRKVPGCNSHNTFPFKKQTGKIDNCCWRLFGGLSIKKLPHWHFLSKVEMITYYKSNQVLSLYMALMYPFADSYH